VAMSTPWLVVVVLCVIAAVILGVYCVLLLAQPPDEEGLPVSEALASMTTSSRFARAESPAAADRTRGSAPRAVGSGIQRLARSTPYPPLHLEPSPKPLRQIVGITQRRLRGDSLLD
jgi:hypothetical protein